MCFEYETKSTKSAVTKVSTPAPMPAPVFHKGDKVFVSRTAKDHENGWENVWNSDMSQAVGKVGTVASVSASGVQLDFPGHPNRWSGGPSGFYYPEFVLTPATETAPLPPKAPSLRLSKTLITPNTVLTVARSLAVELAQAHGVVTADDVQHALVVKGYKSTDLGNAAGSLFRGKNWRKFGAVRSTRQGNHGREITQWQLVS